MHCNCGAETKSHSHKVITLAKAKEWYPDVTADDLPIIIYREVCDACGREHKWPYKSLKKLVKTA